MIAEDEKVLHAAKSVIEDNEEETFDGNRKQGIDEEQILSTENLSGEELLDSVDGEDKEDGEGYSTDRSLEHVDAEQLDPAHNPANGLPFYKFLCFRLEKLWKRKREKQAHKRWKEREKLEYILPRNMLMSLNGHSVFPFLRLLLPEQDSRRQFRVKEKKIAEAYCKAQGFGKGTKNYEMLMVCYCSKSEGYAFFMITIVSRFLFEPISLFLEMRP